MTHTETPDKGQNITTASQRRDRLSDYGGFIFFYHVGSTCILGSVAKSCSTLCDPMTAAHQASLPFTISPSLFKLMSTESLMPSNHLILCHPLLLLPSIFLSIRVFSNESVLRIMWLKYSSFSISPSNEY